jgi:DNA uptake protein ComE-like DNA-binding protein
VNIGIAPQLAEAMIKRRGRKRFKNIDELLEISGFTPELLASVRDRITID